MSTLKDTGILDRTGPSTDISRALAESIWNHNSEISELAGKMGAAAQDVRIEKLEWCRLTAMLIEHELSR